MGAKSTQIGKPDISPMCKVKLVDLTVAYRTQPVSYSWFPSPLGPHAIYSRCPDGADKLIDVVTKIFSTHRYPQRHTPISYIG